MDKKFFKTFKEFFGFREESKLRLPFEACYEQITKEPRSFGSGRRDGRKHAGVDIYCDLHQWVKPMEEGVVTHVSNNFYKGMGAVTVTGKMFCIRYAEIDPKVKLSDVVTHDSILGTVMRTEWTLPMLHLEMYSRPELNPAVVPLTANAGHYRRRTDLLDPTTLLLYLYRDKND